jgi:hypothetical protein
MTYITLTRVGFTAVLMGGVPVAMAFTYLSYSDMD